MSTQWKLNWLCVASLHLAAVNTAASLSRAFVRQHLKYLKLTELVDDAELVMSELVTNAVQATGSADPDVKVHDIGAELLIGVQLRLVESSLFVEVWDRSVTVPVKRAADEEAESGRGLVLVEAVTRRCGVFRPPAGGKVVWGELALAQPPHRAEDGLPLPRPLQELPATSSRVREQAGAALLARVQDGLRQA